jgi:hypothetical protein
MANGNGRLNGYAKWIMVALAVGSVLISTGVLIAGQGEEKRTNKRQDEQMQECKVDRAALRESLNQLRLEIKDRQSKQEVSDNNIAWIRKTLERMENERNSNGS